MSTAISRMQFLRGDYSGRNSPIRPPWAQSEKRFISLCDGCGSCIENCPSRIIQHGRGRFPQIDFSSGECLFCEECVNACKPGALQKTTRQKPWSVTASIMPDKCLAYRNIECRGCYDPCEARAITMTPRVGGVSIPRLDAPLCTGCGACFTVCPGQAINMNPNPVEV